MREDPLREDRFRKEDLQPVKGVKVLKRGRFGKNLSRGEVGLSS